MRPVTPEIQKVCSTVVYSSTRPRMYTDNGTVSEIINFWHGLEYGLFYPERETPLKLFCDIVIKAKDEYPFVLWTRVIQEYYNRLAEPEDWFQRFLEDFQSFCVTEYGKDFAINELNE